MSQPAESGPNPPGAQSSVAVVAYGTLPPRTQASFDALGLVDKLKIYSLILGLITILLIAIAYNGASWFTTFDEKYCSSSGNCTIKTFYPEEECNKLNKKLESLKRRTHPCPSEFFVVLPLYLLLVVWLGTLIVLTILLFANISKSATFCIIDMVGHLKAGLLAIICGLCLFIFCLNVFSRHDELCKNGNGQLIYSTTTGKQLTWEDQCQKEEEKRFKEWYLFTAGFFAFITAVSYIVIGILAFKSRKGQQVRPMQGQYGASMQAQSAPQGSGSTPQQNAA